MVPPEADLSVAIHMDTASRADIASSNTRLFDGPKEFLSPERHVPVILVGG